MAPPATPGSPHRSEVARTVPGVAPLRPPGVGLAAVRGIPLTAFLYAVPVRRSPR
jgi:hypothetical protein